MGTLFPVHIYVFQMQSYFSFYIPPTSYPTPDTHTSFRISIQYKHIPLFFILFFLILYSIIDMSELKIILTNIFVECRRKKLSWLIWWALYILYKYIISPIRHLGPAVGNLQCVPCISSTLFASMCNKINSLWPGCWPALLQLTHLSLDKMAAILQTIFSNAFSWMTSFVFWLKVYRSLYVRVQLTITQHWFR